MQMNWPQYVGGQGPTNRPPDAGHPWPKHNNNAACGEIMALYAYFADRGGDLTGDDLNNKFEDAKNKLKGAHVVTVKSFHEFGSDGFSTEEPLPYDEIVRYDACGTDQRNAPVARFFGCYQITRDKFGIQGSVLVCATWNTNANS